MSHYVVCIGTSNIDIQGFAGSPVVAQDKNPGGVVEVWAGGVAATAVRRGWICRMY